MQKRLKLRNFSIMGLAMTLTLILGVHTPSLANISNSVDSSSYQPPSIKKTVRTTKTSKARKVKVVKVKRVKKTKKFTASKSSPPRLQKVSRSINDPLALQSSVALVIDPNNSDVLFSKNPHLAQPIASITKLMTALVVLDAGQPLNEPIEITDEDLDTEKGTGSRLAIGTVLSRGDLLHVALMSSENRAAHALGRNYPGGIKVFVQAMNAKAQLLGMYNSHFVDPTGLSSKNVASAEDLARLVMAASVNPTIRQFSTDEQYGVPVLGRMVVFRNTNPLITNPHWNIVLQKTGYISEAGKCVVMQALIQGKNVVIVLLDSVSKNARTSDANQIKKWMEIHNIVPRQVTS